MLLGFVPGISDMVAHIANHQEKRCYLSIFYWLVSLLYSSSSSSSSFFFFFFFFNNESIKIGKCSYSGCLSDYDTSYLEPNA
jgi:hypothetical protein